MTGNHYKEPEAKTLTPGKCPRCGGYLLNDYGDKSCVNCGYRQLQDHPRTVDSAAARPETVLFKHELKNLKHLKAIARGE